MTDLASRECVPCKGGIPPLEGEALLRLHSELGNGWQLEAGHHLDKTYEFSNFVEALEFANRVGTLAEEVNHHPEIRLSWGWVRVILYTHKIDGLTESDFVWAAKADQLTP
jgi:4a-hydroxytetrahydrobiopterin dehydratase